MATNNGYIEVYAPLHPDAHANGFTYEHRILAAEVIGRSLLPVEVVHHVDENRKNNSTNNLWVFATSADHSRFHRTGIAVKGKDGVYTSPKQHRVKASKCRACGKECFRNYCSSECAHFSRRKAERPTREQLAGMLSTDRIEHIARQYGVDGNAVRKWANCYGLEWRRRIRKSS